MLAAPPTTLVRAQSGAQLQKALTPSEVQAAIESKLVAAEGALERDRSRLSERRSRSAVTVFAAVDDAAADGEAAARLERHTVG